LVPVSKEAEPYMEFLSQFPQGLQELGYVLGRDLDIQIHGAAAGGNRDRWPAVLEEIVQLKPDVALAVATFEAVTLSKVTSTIPIVCPALADAVRLGLVVSETNRIRTRNRTRREHHRAADEFGRSKRSTPRA
jgi:ABC-type uncharacterized transport system substrate-binding protein